MKRSDLFTIPNAITFVRLACLPLFVWLAFSANEPIAAGWLLAGLGATDWVDGYLARRLNQVSTVGKILDPTVDRLFLVTAVVTMISKSWAPLWILVAVIVREVVVTVAVLWLAARGARRIDVSWWGKAGTFGLMFALPLFIGASNSSGATHPWYAIPAWICVAGGLPLSYIAAATYVPAARAAMAETSAPPSP